MSRILIIEDDLDIALSVRYSLQREGFEVSAAHDGEAGLQQALTEPPDLLLLDLNLPGIDGLDVCRRLRGDPRTAQLPVIMLTARIDEDDKVGGLEIGADDYLTKPFSIKELVARVRALLRRAGQESPDARVLVAGSIAVDEASRRTTVDEREITLTRKEFDLLATLMSQRGRVLSRERLLENVWGYEHPGTTRTVDVHIRQLRRKLGERAAACIETVVGVGYRFSEKVL